MCIEVTMRVKRSRTTYDNNAESRKSVGEIIEPFGRKLKMHQPLDGA
jgi:hypothetical protein